MFKREDVDALLDGGVLLVAAFLLWPVDRFWSWSFIVMAGLKILLAVAIARRDYYARKLEELQQQPVRFVGRPVNQSVDVATLDGIEAKVFRYDIEWTEDRP